MSPIVLIQPGDFRVVVLTPVDSNSHTNESWLGLQAKIREACIEVIDSPIDLTVEEILSLVGHHPEWKCQAVEAHSVPTWNFVE